MKSRRPRQLDPQPGLFEPRRRRRSPDEAKLIASLRDPVVFCEAVLGQPLSAFQRRLLRTAIPPITVPK